MLKFGHEWFANSITNIDMAQICGYIESFTAYSESLFLALS